MTVLAGQVSIEDHTLAGTADSDVEHTGYHVRTVTLTNVTHVNERGIISAALGFVDSAGISCPEIRVLVFQLEVHWPVCLTTKMLEETAIVVAVTRYGHIIQDVAELINEVYTLDVHLSVTQLGYLKYRGSIEDGYLGLHRQSDLAIATAISGAEGRVTDQVLTSSQELWQATQLTDVLIEVQHTLIGVS